MLFAGSTEGAHRVRAARHQRHLPCPGGQIVSSASRSNHVQRFVDETTLRNIIDRLAAGTPTPIGLGPPTHADVDVDVPALLARLVR